MQQDEKKCQLPAIVLAAGLSTRMGEFKPLLQLDGVPLIRRVIDALRLSNAVSDIIVVTGHRDGDIEAAIAATDSPPSTAITTAFNPDYEKGEMLSSVRAGIRVLLAQCPQAGGFVLAFADQPAVLSSTIAALVRGFLEAHPPLAIPQFAGRRGHPIVLSVELIGEIAALGPADTLRNIVHRHLPRAALVAVEDASILEDLDTPADFARAQAAARSTPPARQS